jgi:hypothetical protein
VPGNSHEPQGHGIKRKNRLPDCEYATTTPPGVLITQDIAEFQFLLNSYRAGIPRAPPSLTEAFCQIVMICSRQPKHFLRPDQPL